MKTVLCPTCGEAVPWKETSPWRPFCSERCRLIDLGEWFDEGRRIPAVDEEGDGVLEQGEATDRDL